MKKDKQWLVGEITKQINIYGGKGERMEGFNKGLEFVLGMVEELEEPEKPIIPQFVADFIEKQKKNGISLLQFGYGYGYFGKNISDPTVYEWVDRNEDKFIKAYLNGYEVKKQKLYRVKLDQGSNYLYVESLHLYKDVVEPLDFYYKFSVKENALKFTSRNQAKGVAELVGGEVEEVTE